MDGDSLRVGFNEGFVVEAGLRCFLDKGVVGDANGWVNTMKQIRKEYLSVSFDTHPSGQSKLSSGLTSGTSDLEMKLPSTYTLEVPGRSVYSEAFFILACQTKLFQPTSSKIRKTHFEMNSCVLLWYTDPIHRGVQ